jgi:hypothetical protein
MIRLARKALGCAVMALGLAAAGAAQAQEEAATVKRASELRDAPADTGRTLATLDADSAVTRLGDRQGPWVKVKAPAGTVGWMHMFDIAPATSSGSNAATGAMRGLTSLFSKPASQKTTTSTSTIGIRGLDAEDISRSQPDAAAVTRMEALRATEADARQFAKQASLATAHVDPLPEPAPVQGGQP